MIAMRAVSTGALLRANAASDRMSSKIHHAVHRRIVIRVGS
jgi:hypothetical protein